MTGEKFEPNEDNLGLNCSFWDTEHFECIYPKAELEGRRSCEGVVDEICLWLKDGRIPQGLTEQQRTELKNRAPDFSHNSDIPAGEYEE